MLRRLFWLVVIIAGLLIVTGKIDRSSTTCTATVTADDGSVIEVPCK